MKVRENLALQAAVILFVAVIAVLAITTGVYYHFLQTERNTTAQLRYDLERLERDRLQYEEDSAALKQLVGRYPEQTPVTHIRHDHALDVCEVFPPDDHLDSAAYRDMVAHLVRAIRDAAVREAEALERERVAERKIDVGQQQHEVRQEEQRRAHVDLAREFARNQAQLAEVRQQNVARWEALAAQLEEKAALLADWELKHERLQQTSARELTATQRRYELMRDRWEESLPDKEFAAPLGNVSLVDGRSRIATIDLGREDLLPRGLTMSVFSGPTDNVAGKRPKGKIEVLRLVDDHAAEARIVADKISDLILPGDVVYTPIWKPGQRRRFALVGRLDIDGDGDCDLAEIRGLIEQQGGAIDAVMDETGEQTGEISIETRYLVVGTLASGDGESNEATSAAGRILARAKELGVDRMSLEKLLETVGYVRGAAAEQLSAGR